MNPTDLHAQARWQPPIIHQLAIEELRALSPGDVARRARLVRAAVETLYVEHRELANAASLMDGVLEDNALSLPGAKTIIGITGTNLVGKSTFVRQWALRHYRAHVGTAALNSPEVPQRAEIDADADHVPVVWVNLGAAAVRGSLNLELLAAVGLDLAKAPPSHRAVSRLQRCGVRLVVLDDMHFLKTLKQLGREALDHIKKLNTDLGERGVTLVLVGADLEATEIWADRQIAGRLQALSINRFADTTKSDRDDWQRLLKAFEDQLLAWFPASPRAVLSHKAPGLLLRRTHGSIRDLHQLLIAAAKHASTDGSWAITPELLERADLGTQLSEQARTESAAIQRRKAAASRTPQERTRAVRNVG